MNGGGGQTVNRRLLLRDTPKKSLAEITIVCAPFFKPLVWTFTPLTV